MLRAGLTEACVAFRRLVALAFLGWTTLEMGTLSLSLHVVVLRCCCSECSTEAPTAPSPSERCKLSRALLGGAAEMAMRQASSRKRSGTTHAFLTAVLGALGQLGRTAGL